jgi:hypothetical protein
MRQFEKVLLSVLVVGALAIFVMVIPDLRRYLKMSTM